MRRVCVSTKRLEGGRCRRVRGTRGFHPDGRTRSPFHRLRPFAERLKRFRRQIRIDRAGNDEETSIWDVHLDPSVLERRQEFVLASPSRSSSFRFPSVPFSMSTRRVSFFTFFSSIVVVVVVLLLYRCRLYRSRHSVDRETAGDRREKNERERNSAVIFRLVCLASSPLLYLRSISLPSLSISLFIGAKPRRRRLD